MLTAARRLRAKRTLMRLRPERSAVDVVFAYHDATKHHFNRYARSAGYLDWANQPNPFRRYLGCRVFLLPLGAEDDTPPYDRLFAIGQIPHSDVCVETISRFFECSLALSAWKQFQGERWSLRCNPSSGNLHPTEGYVLLPPLEGLSDTAGVYHYAPLEHGLELRAVLANETWSALASVLPEGAFLAGLSSIHWREAWKYGERAFRYCQHDIGHAFAALTLAAAMLGWRVRLLDAPGDAAVAALLGLDRGGDFADAEREYPDLLAVVWPGSASTSAPIAIPAAAVTAVLQSEWFGKANVLSKEHTDWGIIDTVADATSKPNTDAAAPLQLSDAKSAQSPAKRDYATARTIVQKRRSAVSFDGFTSISRETFFAMLLRTMPRAGNPLWEAYPEPFEIHLGLFIHRVTGLKNGIYWLIRSEEIVSTLDTIRTSMRKDFIWTKPSECPSELPLYLLTEGDAKHLATRVSCHQDIAGDSAFSLGMIARFEKPIREHGPWFYRRLFWETGIIGQLLYLEAEAAGVRATGIGCFFDDAVHEVFGLNGRAYQSLYHFTVGGPIEDTRLTTLPPYSDTRMNQRGWRVE